MLNLRKNPVRSPKFNPLYSVVTLSLIVGACASAAVGEGLPDAPVAGDPPAAAVGVAMSATDGVYTEPQAERGADLFDLTCGDCHASSEFSDEVFTETWGDRSAYSFYRNISQTMPDDNPGSLEEQVYYDVVAYVLKINGHAAGPTELNSETPNLRDVKLDTAASGQ